MFYLEHMVKWFILTFIDSRTFWEINNFNDHINQCKNITFGLKTFGDGSLWKCLSWKHIDEVNLIRRFFKVKWISMDHTVWSIPVWTCMVHHGPSMYCMVHIEAYIHVYSKPKLIFFLITSLEICLDQAAWSGKI